MFHENITRWTLDERNKRKLYSVIDKIFTLASDGYAKLTLDLNLL